MYRPVVWTASTGHLKYRFPKRICLYKIKKAFEKYSLTYVLVIMILNKVLLEHFRLLYEEDYLNEAVFFFTYWAFILITVNE